MELLYFCCFIKRETGKNNGKDVSRKAAKPQREKMTVHNARGLQAVDNTFDPILDKVYIKINQQAELHPGQF